MKSMMFVSLSSLIFLISLFSDLIVMDEIDEGPDFPKLIGIAKRYDLPMPPLTSTLVLATRGRTTTVEGRNFSSSLDPGIYHPAFLTSDESDTGQAIAYFGWSREKIRDHNEHQPASRKFSLKKQEKRELGYTLDLSNPAAFVTSIQVAERGDSAKALRLYKQFANERYIAFQECRESLSSLKASPEKMLARCIYQFLYEATLDATADQNVIFEKMKALKGDYPWLFSERKQDYYAFARHQFFQSLKLTVSAKPPQPGTVEELLVKWGNETRKFPHHGFFYEKNVECDSSAREIFWRGIRGLRALAALQDDKRLTLHVQPAIMNSSERRLRIGDLAKQLLTQLSGSFDIAEALKKLEEDSLDSGQFFQQAAFTRTSERKISEVHEVPMRVLFKIHPELLADIATEASEECMTDTSLFSVFEAIIESDNSDPRKSLLLCGMYERLVSLGHKRALLQNLVLVDEKACVKRLIPILEALPIDVAGPYWTSEEANFTHVVMKCQTDEVWGVYREVVKRSSVGLRMEMMDPMNYSYAGDQQLERRIEFLSQFLTDSELRDMGKAASKYEGPCAAFTIPKVEVRNFAAGKIDSLLSDKSARPDRFWSEEQWAALRKKVMLQIEQFKRSVVKKEESQ